MSSHRPPQAEVIDLTGRTVVVTGASPGSLGYSTAQILASWGARVAVSTRSGTSTVVDALAAECPAGRIVGHPLELCEAASVASYTEWFTTTCDGQLDVLINNAGVHLDLRSKWSQPTMTPDGYEIHWRTNYLGSAHLTTLLLPALLSTAARTGEARVVNVVSKLHARATNAALFSPIEPYNSWTAYGTSKLALIHGANEIERRYGADGVHGYSLHPGSVYTKIADKGLANSRVLRLLRGTLAPLERRVLRTPIEGAQTAVHCATAPDLSGGQFYRDCAVAPASAEVNDGAARARLWDATQAWIESR